MIGSEEQVTFYTTYGYEKDGVWIVPMRIWVHDKPDFVRRLELKAERKNDFISEYRQPLSEWALYMHFWIAKKT